MVERHVAENMRALMPGGQPGGQSNASPAEEAAAAEEAPAAEAPTDVDLERSSAASPEEIVSRRLKVQT